MASIRERTSKQGETTYAVLFRQGKRQTSETFHDRAKAERFKTLVELLGADKALAELNGTDRGGLTVDELAAKFFAWKESASKVTDRTLKDYRRDYANWIRPTLGHRQADSIDELDVQKWVDIMTRRLDPKSVADRHMILHGMYKFGSAKVRRLVAQNPCLETELPERKKKPPKSFTLGEWAALYATAQQVDPDAADLVLFIASTGWRWSEAAALTVGSVEEYADVDTGRALLLAGMTGVFRRDSQDRSVRVEDEGKSEASRRWVKLPEAAAEVVRRRSVGKGPDDFVFTNRHGRRWHQNNFLERTWTRILAAAGIAPLPNGKRKTPHFLRHMHVAMLDRAGASPAEIQKRIGHGDIQTTFNVYGGGIDDTDVATLDRIDALLTTAAAVRGEVVEGAVVAELT